MTIGSVCLIQVTRFGRDAALLCTQCIFLQHHELLKHTSSNAMLAGPQCLVRLLELLHKERMHCVGINIPCIHLHSSLACRNPVGADGGLGRHVDR